jgi:hypothetical protein
MVIPQAVSQAARDFDTKDAQGNPVKRDPRSLWQSMQMGVPGLRSTVPLKTGKGGQQSPAMQSTAIQKQEQPQ